MKLLTAAQSRELDRLSQTKFGVPSFALMSRAGEAVASAVLENWPQAVRAGVVVVAGKGNNGGDGFVAAKRLLVQGIDVAVALLAQKNTLTGDAHRACAEYTAAGGKIIEGEPAVLLASAGVIVDGIFGTGLSGEVTGLPRRAIEQINASKKPVVAIDIASGVNADTGAIMGAAVIADVTVTFGLAKFGHVSFPGAEFAGELRVVDIGFPLAAVEEIAPSGCLVEDSEARILVNPRATNTHKGSYGHTLIIAGSRGKSGAALLSARGALRAGAGLVTAAVPESIAPVVAAGIPELMTEAFADLGGHFSEDDACARLAALAPMIDAAVVGPGIGVSRATVRMIEWIVDTMIEPSRPIVIDADGLNALARIGPAILRRARGNVVLTPHPGEMARLLGSDTAGVNADRISSARRLVDLTGAVVLLKGNRSVIASPDGVLRVNSSGNPGMASPGMGDVLSGMVGAMLGQGMNALDALTLAVFLHGKAGDRLATRAGDAGYMASELADELPAARRALLKEAED
jgi:hydroxyethylthiazole kinase-like uncharacterized protein yjeF